MDFTRTGVVPSLTMSVNCGSEIPTGTLVISMPSCSMMLNVTAGLVENSPVWVPLPISGMETGAADPVPVVNVTTPSAPPAAPGAKVTAARSTSPLCTVTGNVTLAGLPPGCVSVTSPRVNGAGVLGALTEAPVTVTVLVAVSVAWLVAAEPTAVSGNCAVPPLWSAAAPVMPNPYTLPSLVPTYTLPLSVAIWLNLEPVPIGADQISLSFVPPPERGTPSSPQAPRVPPDPLLSLWCSSQMSPVDGSVPLEVIAGAPEVKPRVKVLLLTSFAVRVPLLLTPILNSRM